MLVYNFIVDIHVGTSSYSFPYPGTENVSRKCPVTLTLFQGSKPVVAGGFFNACKGCFFKERQIFK